MPQVRIFHAIKLRILFSQEKKSDFSFCHVKYRVHSSSPSLDTNLWANNGIVRASAFLVKEKSSARSNS